MGHHGGPNGKTARVFNTPNGAETPGPIGPGGAFEFSFSAKPGHETFADYDVWAIQRLVLSAEPGGIKLFENGKPVSGDITSHFFLWDAGTEKDEEPGLGPNQAPRQKAPNTGEAEHGKVHKVKDAKFAGKNSQFFRVTISAQ